MVGTSLNLQEGSHGRAQEGIGCRSPRLASHRDRRLPDRARYPEHPRGRLRPGTDLPSVVEFLNANLGLLILISVIFLVGDLFGGALPLPLNLPGPIFCAFGAVLLVIFIVRLFLLVGEIAGVGFFSVLEGGALSLPVYLLVFIVVLIAGGYIGLFTDRA
ncbi:hypothetical protein [Methanoculleus chikugoensis]|uniref:hypothetical protein n=1 Tax=Methanoculleus chikugoensis TaxID=118126 RepID=UPI000A8CEC72|nr:hypothetical protein [Methanoculleus chikugoensis]